MKTERKNHIAASLYKKKDKLYLDAGLVLFKDKLYLDAGLVLFKDFATIKISTLKPLFDKISSNNGYYIIYFNNYNNQCFPYKKSYHVFEISFLKPVFNILSIYNPWFDFVKVGHQL